MAWDNVEFCGFDIVSGDKPIDHLSIALNNISLEYMDRFGRKPKVAEVLYALNVVMSAHREKLFSDPELVEDTTLQMKRAKGND